MKLKLLIAVGVAFCSSFTAVNAAFSQSNAFTYQGRLNEEGSTANVNDDLQFAISDSSGGQPFIAGPRAIFMKHCSALNQRRRFSRLS